MWKLAKYPAFAANVPGVNVIVALAAAFVILLVIIFELKPAILVPFVAISFITYSPPPPEGKLTALVKELPVSFIFKLLLTSLCPLSKLFDIKS